MKKIIGFLLVFWCVVSLAFSQTQYKKFYRLGIAPLVNGGVKTPDQLRQLLEKEKGAVRLALRNHEIPESIFEQVGQANIEGVMLRPGERFEEMVFRVLGRLKTTGRIEWAGNEPIDAFCFSLNAKNKRYVFVVPKICGNITLWKVEDVVQKSEEEFAKVFVPEIEERPILEPAKPIEKPLLLEKEKTKTSFFTDLALGAFRGCHQEYFVERIGLKYWLSGECFLMLSSGMSFPIGKDAAEWKKVFHGDATFFCDLESVSVGLGVGYSSKVREWKKEQIEFIANFGLNLKKRINLFVEGRLPISFSSGSQSASDNHKIVAGVRFFF